MIDGLAFSRSSARTSHEIQNNSAELELSSIPSLDFSTFAMASTTFRAPASYQIAVVEGVNLLASLIAIYEFSEKHRNLRRKEAEDRAEEQQLIDESAAKEEYFRERAETESDPIKKSDFLVDAELNHLQKLRFEREQMARNKADAEALAEQDIRIEESKLALTQRENDAESARFNRDFEKIRDGPIETGVLSEPPDREYFRSGIYA